MPRSLSILLALSIILLSNLAVCHAQVTTTSSSEFVRSVSSTGTGIIKIPSDQAIITFQITTTGDTPQEAFALNEAISASVLTSLRTIQGVNETSIQLLNLNLSPHQDYIKNSTFEGYVQNGYDVIRTVQVTVNDVDLVPSIVATVVEGSSNATRINSVSYGLQDSTRLSVELQTLSLATTNARQRALSIVNSLPGLTLGLARSASEGSVVIPSPFFLAPQAMKLAATPAAEGTPAAFAPGLIEVQSTVSTVFEMVPTAMMV